MSNTLQIGLAITGGVLLAGVVAHSAWQARKSQPRQPDNDLPLPADPVLERATAAMTPDPDADAAWAETATPDVTEMPVPEAPAVADALAPVSTLDAAAPAAVPAPAPVTAVSPGAIDAMPAAAAAATVAAAPASAPRMGVPSPAKRPPLDALIDAIVPIKPEGIVSGDAVLAALPASRRAGGKPFAIEGLNDTTGEWEPAQPGQRYRQLQAGLQLANRQGPMNEIEFSEFVMKVQGFADAVNAMPDFPDMLKEVARARELDEFAGQHDAQLNFSLRARQSAWSPAFVQQHAARLGFVPGVMPGRMVLPSAQVGAAPILSLNFDPQAALSDDVTQSAIREATLSLDVPQVPRDSQAFVQMRDVAASLAQSLDGVVTDDQGHPFLPQWMDDIGKDLDKLYDTLAERDLAAGSPQARRLFS